MACALLAAALLMSSCLGSFKLFNNVLGWNQGLSRSKFLNELVFLLISPAYVVCGVGDMFIFNTIEFWSGNNPIAMRPGESKRMLGPDGRYYAVRALDDGYEITKPDGQSLRFAYNAKTDSWSQIEAGEVREMFRFNPDGTVCATLPDGSQMDVAATDAGLYSVRTAINGGTYWPAE